MGLINSHKTPAKFKQMEIFLDNGEMEQQRLIETILLAFCKKTRPIQIRKNLAGPLLLESSMTELVK